jgi:hypothetical protein
MRLNGSHSSDNVVFQTIIQERCEETDFADQIIVFFFLYLIEQYECKFFGVQVVCETSFFLSSSRVSSAPVDFVQRCNRIFLENFSTACVCVRVRV